MDLPVSDPWSRDLKCRSHQVSVPGILLPHFMAEPELVRDVITLQLLEHDTWTPNTSVTLTLVNRDASWLCIHQVASPAPLRKQAVRFGGLVACKLRTMASSVSKPVKFTV